MKQVQPIWKLKKNNTPIHKINKQKPWSLGKQKSLTITDNKTSLSKIIVGMLTNRRGPADLT